MSFLSPTGPNKSLKIALILSLLGNLLILYVSYKALDYRDHVNYFRDKYLQAIDKLSGRPDFIDENRLLAADSTVPNRVVFFGTQMTRWWKLASSFPEYEALNRGISGQRVAGYLLRFRSDVVELHPAATVIELSSYNFRPENSVEEIQEYIASLIDIAQANHIATVILTVLPIGKDFDAEIEEPYSVMDSLRQFNGWLRAYADTANVSVVDAYAAMVNPEGFLDPDLAHGQINVTAEGYARLTKLTKEALVHAGVPPWGTTPVRQFSK